MKPAVMPAKASNYTVGNTPEDRGTQHSRRTQHRGGPHGGSHHKTMGEGCSSTGTPTLEHRGDTTWNVGRSSQAVCLMRNTAMDDSIGGS